jgi:hypothetical protein
MNPETYYNSDIFWLGYGGADVTLNNTDRMSLADEGIQIVFKEDHLAPGESTCFRFFYGLSIGVEEDLVVDPFPSPSTAPSFIPRPSPSESPMPTPEPSPSQIPVPTVRSCVDKPEMLTCDLVAQFDACNFALPYQPE